MTAEKPTSSPLVVDEGFDLETLAQSIRRVHTEMSVQATRAINISLTVRNWLIGCYIVEYEQHGRDRAEYGDRLIEELAKRLKKIGVKRADARELRRYRKFYTTYRAIWETLTPESRKLLPANMLGHPLENQETASPVSASDVITRLSFSHICELMAIDDPENNANLPEGSQP